MANLNKVFLIGNLGQQPEKKTLPSGKTLVQVSLATNEFFTDRNGEKRQKTEWHRLIFWEKLASLVAEYCNKGSSIYVEGSLRNNEWQDKDGNKRITTEVVVRSLQFLGEKERSGSSMGPQQDAPSYNNENLGTPLNEDIDDDIPF